ncbi:MAG: class A beta-lactamase-related serine hydrolase [Burkholderiales bacterium]|nr:MAG: class A beta-lactamase-related serine hydrolase [Burkholderiales bacterium]
MLRQFFKAGSGALLAAASIAVLSACSHDGKPVSAASPETVAKAYDNPVWPAAAVSDPSRLGFTAEGLQALDARMKEAVDRHEIAGISYALVKDGQVADLKFYGSQSLGGPPIDKDSLFRIRSIGKTITGVAMMQLWEQGKWKPEDPITKFLPELANLRVATSADNLDNTVPVSRPPTMGELMTHTGGFGYGLILTNAVERAFVEKDMGHSPDMKTLVKRVSEIPLMAQPGQKWNYSIGYDLQGVIIERISGKTLGDYYQQNIFAPLGMKNTGFWLKESDRPHLTTVYTRNTASGVLEPLKDAGNVAADDPFKKNSNFESGGGGASGLISTLHDYVRFTQMLVNKGELGGHRVLKPETVDYMTQNHIGSIRGVLGGDGYGFGYGGRVVVNGSTATTAQPNGAFSHFSIEGAWFWVDPANKIAFVGMIQRRGQGGPGSVALGGDGDAPRLVYKALQK